MAAPLFRLWERPPGAAAAAYSQPCPKGQSRSQRKRRSGSPKRLSKVLPARPGLLLSATSRLEANLPLQISDLITNLVRFIPVEAVSRRAMQAAADVVDIVTKAIGGAAAERVAPV